MKDEVIWSTGLNSSSSMDVQAVLLDNGNLVLRDGPTSSAAVLWQSFDHLLDTWLPGARLKLGSQLLTSWKSSTYPSPGRYSLQVDPKTQSLVTVWNGSKSYWSSEPWDDRLKTFKGFPGTDVSFKWNLDESYITYLVDPQSTYRLVMDVSGKLIRYSWFANYQVWHMLDSVSFGRCDVYNYCGPFGICNESQRVPCRCVPGFKRVFGNISDSNDFSGGCKRETKLQCGKGSDKFLAIRNMKLDTDPTTLVLTASPVTLCASACLANCSCQAYAYDGNTCLMWTTYALNLQQLDANQRHPFFLRVTTSNKGKTKDHIFIRIVLAVVLSSLVAAAAFFRWFVLLHLFKNKKKKNTKRRKTEQRAIRRRHN